MSAQINLYNAELNQKKLAFSARMFSQILGLGLVIMVGATWYLNVQTVKLEQRINNDKAQLTAAQTQLAKVTAENPPRTRSKLLEQQIGLLDAEIKSLLMAEELLKKGNFGNPQGYSAYLAALARQSQEGLWLTEISVGEAGRELGLRGRAVRAELVPQFIGRLASEPAMRGKSFDALELRRVTEEVARGSNPGAASGNGTGSASQPVSALNLASPPAQGAQAGEAGANASGNVGVNVGLAGVLGNLNLGPDVRRILNQLAGGSLAAVQQAAAPATLATPATPNAAAIVNLPSAATVPTVSSIEFSLQAHPPQRRTALQEAK